jgi:hypothetical protein
MRNQISSLGPIMRPEVNSNEGSWNRVQTPSSLNLNPNVNPFFDHLFEILDVFKSFKKKLLEIMKFQHLFIIHICF